MDKEQISKDKWEGYLKDLYDWISEKYDLLISGEIDNDEYSEHLTYYDKEKKRIEGIIYEEQAQLDEEDPQPDRKKFTQETFENFFGVKLYRSNSDSITTQIPSDSPTPTPVYEANSTVNITPDTPTSTITPSDNISEQNAVLAYTEEEKAKTADYTAFTKQDIEFGEQILSANILLIGDSTVGRTSIRRSWMGK
ncbi:MAG: hypothetical protein ACXAC2_09035, partial [Candidatus Kariarchaeaceae archaeon]